MNVYGFELRMLVRPVILWTISIISVFFLFLFGVYPVFEEGMEAMVIMMANMPEEMVRAFGLEVTNLVSYTGFYSFSFLYYGLLGGIMALSITIGVFGREKANQCQEFLFAKPISGKKLYRAKLGAVLTSLGISSIGYSCVSLYGFHSHALGEEHAVLLSILFVGLQLCFMAMGLLVVTYKKRMKMINGMACGIGFTCFLLQVVVNLLEEHIYTYCSPFHYFSPQVVVEQGAYEVGYCMVASIFVLLSVGVSYQKYTKADIGSHER